MSKMLKALGIVATCLGSVAVGIAVLRANDEVKDAQLQKVKAAVEERLTQKVDFPGVPLAEVKISGNETIPAEMILDKLKFRESPGEPLNWQQIKENVRALYGTQWFFQVEPRIEKAENGIVLTYRVVERPADQRFRPTDANALATAESSAERRVAQNSDRQRAKGDADKVRADSEFADSVEKFNELMDQKRFPEAELLAEELRKLQPLNPVTEAMDQKVKQAIRDLVIEQFRSKAVELEKQERKAAKARKEMEEIEKAYRVVNDRTATKPGGNQIPKEERATEAEPATPEATSTKNANGLRLNGVTEFDVDLDETQRERMKVRFEGDPRQYYGTFRPQPATSPAMQEAFKKIVEVLKTEMTDLEKRGKKEEAAKKRQTIEQLEAAMRGESNIPEKGVVKPTVRYEPMQERLDRRLEQRQLEAELERAAEKLEQLQARRKQLLEDNRQPEAESLDVAIVVLKADIAGRKAKLRNMQIPTIRYHTDKGDGTAGQTESLPEASEANTEIRKNFDVLKAITGDSAFVPGGAIAQQQAKLRERLQQSQVLVDAAAKLKEVGLENQSQTILKAAEEARQESARLQSEIQTLQKMQRALETSQASVPMQGGAPHQVSLLPELHRTLTEVREKVQALRKDVRQVRELLENKP